MTDNELYFPDSAHYSEEYVERLAEFTRHADLLITDCTFTDDEYRRKMSWGHSCVSQVADLAARARVKTLCLFHHDPDQTDAIVDGKLAQMRELVAARLGGETTVIAPAQLTELEI